MNTFVYLTSSSEADWEFARKCALALRTNEDRAHEDVSLLLHREGVRLVVDGSSKRDETAELLEEGITVKAGASCLDARDLSHDGVVSGVELVPSGVSELAWLQSEGYNHVKVP